MWEKIKKNQEIQVQLLHIMIFTKWLILSTIIGGIVGLIAVIFSKVLGTATSLRTNNPYLVYALPFAGLVIVFLYHLANNENCKGTNLIISSIRSDEKITPLMAPLIFIATAITHLFGGSAGREGAALQLGGSIGQNIAKCLKLNTKDSEIMTMCAMTAAFAGLFGTPLTATIFSMEVISVGIMHYAALVPCALTAIIASTIAKMCGIHPEGFVIQMLPEITLPTFIKVCLLAALCSYVSILFCYVMHEFSHQFAKFKNPYLRIFIGGCIIILLTMIFGRDYNGAGMNIIEACIHEGIVKKEAFILKLLFTAITIGAGYKGGEIVPCFFVGATFGTLVAPLLGLPASFGGALGLVVLFCGVTNCPVTSLFLSFELFGFVAIPLFLIADAIGYMLSGYYGLYSEQKIMYSKYTSSFVDSHANSNVD